MFAGKVSQTASVGMQVDLREDSEALHQSLFSPSFFSVFYVHLSYSPFLKNQPPGLLTSYD